MVTKSRRHPCPTVDELKSLAQRPVLHKDEAIALIQGFCPDRSSPKGCFSYLTNYAPQVETIVVAETNGDIAFPIKNTDWVIWCNENNVALPEIYVCEVTTRIIRVRRPKSIGTYTDELVRLSKNDHNRDLIRRGRKRVKEVTVRGYEPTIVVKQRPILSTNQRPIFSTFSVF